MKWTRRRRRLFGGCLLISAGVLCGSPFAIDSWADRHLTRHAQTWRAGCKEEANWYASARLPALSKPELDENAADHYRLALERVEEPSPSIFVEIEHRDPFEPLSREALRWLDAQLQTLAPLEQAARCTRCDWGLQPGLRFDPTQRSSASWVKSLDLALLVTASGHAAAQRGDPQRAARLYLLGARFGTDLSRGPLSGIHFGTRALSALARLIASDASAKLNLDEIESALKVLEESWPARSRALRSDWLQVCWWARADAPSIKSEAKLDGRFARFLPERWVLAHALNGLEAEFLRADLALEARSLDLWHRREDAIHHWTWGETWAAVPSWNPIINHLYPHPATLSDAHDEALTWLRFALSAAALERRPTGPARSAQGAVPLRDPFDSSRVLSIEVESAGSGYRISTSGPVRHHGESLQDQSMELIRRSGSPEGG